LNLPWINRPASEDLPTAISPTKTILASITYEFCKLLSFSFLSVLITSLEDGAAWPWLQLPLPQQPAPLYYFARSIFNYSIVIHLTGDKSSSNCSHSDGSFSVGGILWSSKN